MTRTMPARRPLRIFVASAAELLTDHAQHGEGLIAWQTFSALAGRGHELVVCAREIDLASEPPFEVVETGRRLRLESLEPLAYARHVRRHFEKRGGADAFDAVHWLFPQEPLCFVPPRGVNFVLGPRSPSWAAPLAPGAARPRRAGDVVRTATTPIFDALRRVACSRASRILVSTPLAAEGVPPRERSKVEVRPFGVDLARFPQRALPETPTVLYVGRLDPIKRVRELVEAFATVRRKLPDARLMVAGDGPERSSIEASCRELGIDGAVELLGRVRHDGVPALLGRCTLLCLPSVGEPFGMVVLEAMASARAVVAVAGGGPDWLVDPGRGGALASSGRPAVLAEAMVEVLGDVGQAEHMGAHNRERAEAEFGLETLAESLENAYRSGSRSTPGPERAVTAERAAR